MRCIKCAKPATYSIQNNPYCRFCFPTVIEKRIRKYVRLNKLIKKGDKILIFCDSTYNSKNTLLLFDRIIKNLPIKIDTITDNYSIGQKVNQNKYNSIIFSWTLDDEINYFLECVLNNIPPKFLGNYSIKDTRYIKFLLPILDKESKDYAKINGLKCKARAKHPLSTLFDTMEERYPEIRYSIFKTSQQLKF